MSCYYLNMYTSFLHRDRGGDGDGTQPRSGLGPHLKGRLRGRGGGSILHSWKEDQSIPPTPSLVGSSFISSWREYCCLAIMLWLVF